MATADSGIHTVPNPDGSGWANQEGGTTLSRHRSKGAAVAHGRRLAMRALTDHFVHSLGGCVRQKNSYGPCPPPLADSGAATT